MENFKNEFVSELLYVGFDTADVVKVLNALAVAAKGYEITKKDANIAIYDGLDTTNKLIKLYVECKRVEGCSPAFYKNIGIILPKLFEYCGKDYQSICSFDIRGFLAYWQKNRNVSNATLDKYRQYINAFYVWMIDEGYSGKNPCKSIKKIKQETKERESLSQMELEQIRSRVIGSKERMVVEVLYSTGCRAAELAGIKLSDIHWRGIGTTVHVTGKGNKQREVPLNAKAQVAVKNYIKDRGFQSEYLFASERAPHGKVTTSVLRVLIKAINDRVAGEISHYLHPHLFRHTTATIALNSGMPVQEVQQLLGHSKLDTTMIYAKTDKNQMLADHVKYVV